MTRSTSGGEHGQSENESCVKCDGEKCGGRCAYHADLPSRCAVPLFRRSADREVPKSERLSLIDAMHMEVPDAVRNQDKLQGVLDAVGRRVHKLHTHAFCRLLVLLPFRSTHRVDCALAPVKRPLALGKAVA
jgi:hypothetical protein